jgi:hypothetical protein
MSEPADKATVIGQIVTLLFIGLLIVGGISVYSESKNNPAPAANPTATEQPNWSEPNFDNLDTDGFINGQR